MTIIVNKIFSKSKILHALKKKVILTTSIFKIVITFTLMKGADDQNKKFKRARG